jgi:hypothetical protein
MDLSWSKNSITHGCNPKFQKLVGFLSNIQIPFFIFQNIFYLAITSDVVHKQIHSKQIFEQSLTLHIQQFQTI